MADLASMPIQGITDLEVPLPVRLLTELRRSRGNLTGGSNPGRAE
ncbi:aldo/keto reductase [Streptomyces sp. NPDC005820]